MQPHQRAAFARKAEWYLSWGLNRNGWQRPPGATPKGRTAPARTTSPPILRQWFQQRGIYLRGSNVGSLAKFAATRRASSIVSTSAMSASARVSRPKEKKGELGRYCFQAAT